MPDKAKLILAGVLASAGLAAYFFLQGGLYANAGMLAGVVGALVIVAYTEYGLRSFEFVKEARVEMMKVVWPDRNDVMRSTGMILLMVGIMAVGLYFIDMVLLWIVRFIMRSGG